MSKYSEGKKKAYLLAEWKQNEREIFRNERKREKVERQNEKGKDERINRKEWGQNSLNIS